VSAKSVLIHGRPGPSPAHAELARAIGADFQPIDFILRWHDTAANPLRRYLSWLLCSMFFPNRKSYQLFLSEGLHFLPLIMRFLGRMDGSQRTVALLAEPSLFFLHTRRYPISTDRALRWALGKYDALACVGQMQTRLARSLVSTNHPPLIVTVSIGISKQRLSSLQQARPSLAGDTLVFIGHGPDGWRGWCKGFDLLLHAVGLAARRAPGLRLRVIGDWDQRYVRQQMSRLPCRPPEVEFMGRVDDLVPCLADAALCIHLGRGDAFPVSVLEAMSAGIPALVSEWTGTCEAVELADRRLVVPLDADEAASRILWYLDLPIRDRRSLSESSREIAAQYTVERAREIFVAAYREVLLHFGLEDDAPLKSEIPNAVRVQL